MKCGVVSIRRARTQTMGGLLADVIHHTLEPGVILWAECIHASGCNKSNNTVRLAQGLSVVLGAYLVHHAAQPRSHFRN